MLHVYSRAHFLVAKDIAQVGYNSAGNKGNSTIRVWSQSQLGATVSYKCSSKARIMLYIGYAEAFLQLRASTGRYRKIGVTR